MAATAYAALRSLLTTVAMEQTPSPLHPRPFPFPSALIHSLLETVRFMVDFLEQDYYCTDAEHLVCRITHLAYAAEDAIEIHILHRLIRSRSDFTMVETPSPFPFLSGFIHAMLERLRSMQIPILNLINFREDSGQDLESIIQDLDLVKAEILLLMKDKSSTLVQDVHPGGFRSSSSSSSSTAPTQMDKIKMVGFDEYKSTIIHELTRFDFQRGLQIIPIAGMGGIGKTTLASNLYADDHITKHFDVRAWVTVSQQYNINDILEKLLSSIPNKGTCEISREQLYKSLFNRRYLVAFDDMWSIDVLDELRQYFPDNFNGSRIITTTRLSNLAAQLSTGFMLGMKCLDEENSWNLFCEKVFLSESCPLELVDVGKKIVQNCGGLPLAIVVIGGLLAKSNQTLKYWEHVAEDFHSCLYSSDDDHCSKVLFLSYNYLPIHLKPCLLYLGVFPEDKEIPVSQLMRLWIAEGFLKPLVGKTLDEIAEKHLKDLIERNLIMVSTYSKGKIKYIIIHDLLRELCLREAQKDMFYCVVMDESIEVPLSPAYQRRIVIGDVRVNAMLFSDRPYSMVSMRHVRTLILTMVNYSSGFLKFPSHFSSFIMPLRIFFSPYHPMVEVTGKFTASMVNMRYLVNGRRGGFSLTSNPYSSIGLCRNFQMLDDHYQHYYIGMWNKFLQPDTIDIWNLVQLLRVRSSPITLPEHPYWIEDPQNCIVLETLQSLGTLVNFRFSEEAVRRIPNVKKLKVAYNMMKCQEWSYYMTHNLQRLEKLESFSYQFDGFAPNRKEFLQSVAFSPCLKKLSLGGCKLEWKDTIVFGSLPNLEVLKLYGNAFIGAVWNPIEGVFRCLKFLKMDSVVDLMKWNADGTHFPRLEMLVLMNCLMLEEIPLDFGEISTLQLIKIRNCSVSAMQSAKYILEEQQRFGHEDLVVEVYSWYKYRSIHDVEIKNFVATSLDYMYAADSDTAEESDKNDEGSSVSNGNNGENDENDENVMETMMTVLVIKMWRRWDQLWRRWE